MSITGYLPKNRKTRPHALAPPLWNAWKPENTADHRRIILTSEVLCIIGREREREDAWTALHINGKLQFPPKKTLKQTHYDLQQSPARPLYSTDQWTALWLLWFTGL